jgi:hypothetical protein
VDFNSTSCNNKLVGAKAFDAAGKAMAGSTNSVDVVPSPRYVIGHDTHALLTATGSEVCNRNTDMLKFVLGTMRGVAPKARIATNTTPTLSSVDVIMAIDTVVKDDVDILDQQQLGWLTWCHG